MPDQGVPPERGDVALLKISTACGILGPIIYAFVVFIVGFFTPGYSQATRLMSELGESGAPHATVMNLGGFLLLGVLLIVFSPGLRAALKPSPSGRAGAFLVAAAGITYLGEAAFPCDRECIPVTFAGSVHLLIGDIAVFVAVLAALILTIAMRPDPRWSGYWQYSVATGILVIALLPLFPIAGGFTGAVQRLVAGVILLWLSIIALRAWRIVGEKGT